MKKTLLIMAVLALTASAAAQVQRRTVLEEFSTAKCQYCPLGVQYIEAGLAGRPDVIWIVHHAGFLTDDITVPASSALTYLYVGGSYAPAFMLDRTIPANPMNPGTPVMDIVDSAELVALVDEISALPCHTSVELVDVSYDAAARRLTGSVQGCVAGEFDPEWTLLSVYIVEDSIVLPQVSTSGMIPDYVHMHAVHGALTEKNGSALSFAADGSFSFGFDNLLPADIDPAHSHLVALVHEYSRGNRAANRVLNATAMQTTFTGSPLSIDRWTVESGQWTVAPNPATDHVDIVCGQPIRRLVVADMAGRTVYCGTDSRIDTRSWPAGVYILQLATDSGIGTKRLIKQ